MKNKNKKILRAAHGAQLVASYLTTLYLLTLEEEDRDKENESDGAVEFLGKHLNASKSPITAILFHLSSSWIITGDQQGNGKKKTNSQFDLLSRIT